MPTDLVEAFIQRRTERAQLGATVSLGLVSLILCLTVLVLLFLSDDFAQAVTQMGLLELGRSQQPVVAPEESEAFWPGGWCRTNTTCFIS